MKKILANLTIVGLFIIPFIRLIVADSQFFPFITGKNFTFRIVVEVVTALWLILLLIDKGADYAPRKTLIAKAILLFAGITLIADLFSPNVGKSLWSNFERMEGWVTIAHLALYFFVMTSVFVTEKIWKRYFNTFQIVSAILCIYGFFQLGGVLDIHQGSTRLDATLGNSAYLAVFMLVSFFITIYLIYENLKTRKNNYLISAYFLLGISELVILYYTGTRGSILGLIGGLALGTFIAGIAVKGKVRLYAASLLALIVIIVGGFQTIKDTEFVQNSPVLKRLAAITLADAAPRLAIWNMAYEGFKERPILGWGQESFNYVFNKYYEPKMYTQEQWFDRAHNVFFDWLIAGGILGLLSYLSLFAVLVWYIWKGRNNSLDIYEKVIFTALFTAYFIHNLFVFDNLVSYILFFTLLGFFHVKNEGNKVGFLSKLYIHKDIENMVVIPGIAVALVIVIYFVNVRPIKASTNLIQAISQQSGGVTQNLEYYKKAISYNSFGNQEIREQLMNAATQIISSNTSLDVKEKFYEFSREQVEAWTKESPQDARAHLFAGTLLGRYSQFADALPYLEKAVELSPNKQTIMFELGSNYLRSGQYAKGLEVMKKAYELEPSYRDARHLYALALIYNNREAEARTILGDEAGMIEGDSRFHAALAASKNYSRLMSIYEARIKANPKDTQSRVSLAAVFLAMGSRQAAIAQLETAIRENPGFKAQGEYFISEIRAGRNP